MTCEGNLHTHSGHGASGTAGGAAIGSFWGFLFGLLFFIPFAGLAIGAGMGALFGHFGEKGIDKAFQEQVRDYLKPGTSALFMVIEQATPDKAIAALEQYGGTVIRTSLSDEDTKKLQEALAADGRRRLGESPAPQTNRGSHLDRSLTDRPVRPPSRRRARARLPRKAAADGWRFCWRWRCSCSSSTRRS